MPIKPHIQQVSLIKDSDAMRRGLAPGDLVDRLASRFDSIEKDIVAFVPEDRRFERLQRDAEALVKPLSSTSRAAAALRRVARRQGYLSLRRFRDAGGYRRAIGVICRFRSGGCHQSQTRGRFGGGQNGHH